MQSNIYKLDSEKYIAHFNAALLKVASRCNLNCDYCYMYHHADQSWRSQPKLMTDDTIYLFAQRLDEYAAETRLSEFSVIFHGGEPLLYTSERLTEAANVIRSVVTSECRIDFSIQTNGVLLSDKSLSILENSDIGISISLDGPQKANDLHRLDHSGKSTFDETMQAIQRLRASASGIFQGAIAVIDPRISPQELFNFFYPMDLPRLDFLLPDATHVTSPTGRENDKSLYKDWLIRAFELWFKEYSDLPIRFFDAVLGSRLNIPSPTDAFGFGKVSLLVIETDGSYTDHDVFKITQAGANALSQGLKTASFMEIAKHPKILSHSYRLTLEGVAQECKVCPVVEACGGGSIMHRYHPSRGLNAPTVYCREMFRLFETATKLLCESLSDLRAERYENLPSLISFADDLIQECRGWRSNVEKVADTIAQKNGFNRYGVPAAAVMLRHESLTLGSGNDTGFSRKMTSFTWLGKIRVQLDEPWLALPFLDTIKVLPTNSEQFKHGIAVLDLVEMYFLAVNPALPSAIAELISDIIFVQSTVIDETAIFSFSDDSAPNVLYIAPYVGTTPLSPADLADSILHEFLHLVLYQIEQTQPLLYDYDFPRFPAPWRAGFRPAGGFLHGTFVFSGLSKFWNIISTKDLPLLDKDKARRNADKFQRQASYGINSAYHFALLTPQGIRFLKKLAAQTRISIRHLEPPGDL